MTRAERRRRNRKNRGRDRRQRHKHACWLCNHDKLSGKPRRQEVESALRKIDDMLGISPALGAMIDNVWANMDGL